MLCFKSFHIIFNFFFFTFMLKCTKITTYNEFRFNNHIFELKWRYFLFQKHEIVSFFMAIVHAYIRKCLTRPTNHSKLELTGMALLSFAFILFSFPNINTHLHSHVVQRSPPASNVKQQTIVDNSGQR